MYTVQMSHKCIRLYKCITMYLSILSLVDYLGCFQFLALMNKAAINILLYVSYGTYAPVCLGVELLGHRVGIPFPSAKVVTQFYKVFEPIYTTPHQQCMRVLVALYLDIVSLFTLCHAGHAVVYHCGLNLHVTDG